jgi:hypothetical protein
LNAKQSQNSRFQEYRLKYGITVQIPKHWQVTEKSVMDQIDTNTEALTGTPQGNNEILIAANYYSRDLKNATATARISVRHKQTIDQSQLLEMTDSDIQMEAFMGEAALENALKKVDTSMMVTEYKMVRKKFKSFFAFETVYSLNNNERQILYVIPLGDRTIKFHLKYELSEEKSLKPTIMHIIDSFSVNTNNIEVANDQASYGWVWKQNFLLNIVFNLIFYISIPVVIRYAILRKPIKSKWVAVGILVPIFIGFSVFINIQVNEGQKKIFQELNMPYKPGPHLMGSSLLYAAMAISYGILRKRSTKKIKSE